MSTRLDSSITVGLIVAIVFTALAHGAVEAWSIAIFELIVLVLMMMWAVKAIADGRLKATIPTTALPVAALVAVGLAQSAAFSDSNGRRLSLSMDVEATRATVIALLFLLAAFVIAANFFANRERLRALANFLVIYGLAMAVFALVQHFTWNGRFYWLRPDIWQSTSPFGPFSNHNHFAGYMELLISVPVALIVARSVRVETRLFYSFAAAMMGVAAVMSLSRGGMISLAAELIFIMVVSVRLGSNDEGGRARDEGGMGRFPSSYFILMRVGTVVAIVVAIAVGVLWIGADPVINRITRGRLVSADPQVETFLASRGWIWIDTLAMIRANLFSGVGLGAFQTAHPIYSRGNGWEVIGQAHNDYLQVLADCGIVGGAIALWFIVSTCRAVARGIRSRDPLLAGLALGSGASIFGILVHSLFDFNLQLPSHALLFLFFSAVAWHIGTTAAEPTTQRAARMNAATGFARVA